MHANCNIWFDEFFKIKTFFLLLFPDLVSMKKHLKESHDKEDIDNEDPMDFVRYPKNLICIKCNMCGLLCHAQKISEVELHFNIAHEELDFNGSHLQFLCRLVVPEKKIIAVDTVLF